MARAIPIRLVTFLTVVTVTFLVPGQCEKTDDSGSVTWKFAYPNDTWTQSMVSQDCSMTCDNSSVSKCDMSCATWTTTAALTTQGCDRGTVPDGSDCCVTCVKYDAPFALRDPESANPVYVVHEYWNRRYQLVPVGKCGKKKNCRGSCERVPRLYTLLVSDHRVQSQQDLQTANIWFQGFEFPAYCTCRKTSSAPRTVYFHVYLFLLTLGVTLKSVS